MGGLPPVESYAMPVGTDLPRNTAGWVPDPRRAILLVHDMQEYFVRPVPAPEPATALARNCTALRDTAAGLGLPVAYTAQRGGADERERGLLKDFWGPGMKVSEHDRRIIDVLAPRDGDWLLTKHRYSAFHRSDLAERLESAGRDQLILCGVYASIGVLATAVDAFSRDIEVFLAADAVADFTARDHRQALRYAATRCAVVLPTGALVDGLRSAAALTGPYGDRR